MAGLDTSFESAEDSRGLLLWQVSNRWQASQRATLKPLGLTHVQFVLLASLAWLEGESSEPVTQQQLAAHAAADPMMTSQVLRVLEGRGLLQRQAHPADRRARSLVVTPPGRALANQAVVVVEACDRSWFGVLGRDADTLARLLRRLSEAGARD